MEKKEGYFTYAGSRYTVVDLPGTYSLSANSEEEIVTREYIAGGKADLVCILADASQLERSLFMLADYAGVKTPALLLLNMIDVAARQGKEVDSVSISQRLGIPVLPIIALDKKSYGGFFEVLGEAQKASAVLNEEELRSLYTEMIGKTYQQVLALLPDEGLPGFSSTWLAAKLLEQDALALEMVKSAVGDNLGGRLITRLVKVKDGSLLTGECKFKWIENLLQGNVSVKKDAKPPMGRFDCLATSKTWGNPIAVGVIILGLMVSMAIAMPFMGLFGYLPSLLSPPLAQGLSSIGLPAVVISLLCDAVLTAVSFALMMVSFVFGISLVFGFLEEIGYMARISYVFDNVMSKLGSQGKAVMPFLVSFGCNIGGVTATRVIDSWGQRVTTIALSWVVPCAATWSVVEQRFLRQRRVSGGSVAVCGRPAAHDGHLQDIWKIAAQGKRPKRPYHGTAALPPAPIPGSVPLCIQPYGRCAGACLKDHHSGFSSLLVFVLYRRRKCGQQRYL